MNKSKLNMTSCLSHYINTYIKTYNNIDDDVITYNNIKMLRGMYKSYDNSKLNDKKLNGFNITNQDLNKSPFEILNLKYNSVQSKLLSSDFKQYGSYLFNVSCGGGKTLLSIELIHRFKLRTLIISARSAVNDQWLTTLKRLYPSLTVMTRDVYTKKSRTSIPDILIVTPQYLTKYISDVDKYRDMFNDYKFDFIIYDEIHSLLSDEFSYVLALPFILKTKGMISHLPFMLGLTASLPAPRSEAYKLLVNIFGKPIHARSDIVNIPIYFHDLRDRFTDRGKYDINYKPYDYKEALDISLKLLDKNNIKPSVDYKLIILTHMIDESVYAIIKAVTYYNKAAVLIRESTTNDYVFYPNEIPDEYYEIEDLPPEDREDCDLDTVKSKNFAHKCKYQDVLNDVSIIVGTVSRLKEGFNCENITTGICTQFIYSITSRVQILGRIRRSSTNEDLNNHRRIFIVNSGVVPSNIKQPNRRGPIVVNYDFDLEDKLFKDENYIRLMNK